MSDVHSTSQTAYANLDWDHYNQYRPPYPPSLRDIIYDYHDQQGKAGWGQLVDIGGGVGISSVPFIERFETVHLLDPSAMNVEKARVFLGKEVRSRGLQTKLEFTVATAGDAHKHVQDVSLAICATAAHFIDPNELIRSMSEMLSPGGTMAVYTYWLPIFPEQSEVLGVTFAKAMTIAIRLCIRPGDDSTRSLFKKATARLTAGKTILDSIPVPPELFRDARRIRINPDADVSFETYRKDPPVPCEPLPSQVRLDEKQFTYATGQDAEAERWSFPVNLLYLHGMIGTILPADIQLNEEQREALYGQLDKVFTAECPSGTARALFPVSVVLATRRSHETAQAE